MTRCISLAKNGLGKTYPNPLVGCVIVHENIIIGEGWHRKAGTPHAEVHAINSVKDKFEDEASEILSTATIYVCLEPCSYYGKTPPCANLIIQEGIKNVVIGCTDPNPQVAGRGIKLLFEAGCTVTMGIKEEECIALNKRFFTFQNKKRPYIILKWAETLDGFIAPLERNVTKPVWITNEYSRQLVHKMRAEEQAIIIGTNTAIEDNPSLTTRDWYGKSPTRLILDRNLKIPMDAKIYDGETSTIIFTEKNRTSNNQVEFLNILFTDNLIDNILDTAFDRNIQSLIVEGGTQLIQSFVKLNLWDEAVVFRGTSNFEKGVLAPRLNSTPSKAKKLNNDTISYYYNVTADN